MEMTVLPMTIDLYDEVFALWQQTDGIGLSSADSQDAIRSFLERNRGLSFMASMNGKIVGAILAGHDGRRGYLYHLAVHPNYRRLGFGRKLVEHSLQALKKQGIQKCHLFAFQYNAAGIAFWKSIGWTPRVDIQAMSMTIE
ncbi:MAG: GNAT family N-acetyltransferase [Deltaproteobacteria bacterium]|nr:GNAT family N-acetyltransferase [Deltaproteobacteria bacterium]